MNFLSANSLCGGRWWAFPASDLSLIPPILLQAHSRACHVSPRNTQGSSTNASSTHSHERNYESIWLCQARTNA
jgi:hypothetical protein